MFIREFLLRSASRWADRIAVEDDVRALTFAELQDEAFRLANALADLGLEPGDRVLDLQTNAWSQILTDFALNSGGFVRVPLNGRLGIDDLATIAIDSGARGLLFAPAYESVAASLLERSDDLETLVGIQASELGPDVLSLVATASNAVPIYSPKADDLASINYSSGTTGRPKGCMRTARNRAIGAQDMLLGLFGGKYGPDDVFVHAAPVTHASGQLVLPSLIAGARQRLLPRFDPERTLEVLEDGKTTATMMVPTMLERVVKVLEAEDRSAKPGLQWLLYAGAPMAPERLRVARDKFNGRIGQFYGLVECLPPITALPPEEYTDDLLGSAGRPPLGIALEVQDDEGTRLPAGEVGEVVVSGDHVMAGYWRRDATHGKDFRPGMLRTGDMGYLDDQGYLFLIDRRGDMIITGGYNVYPREVESTLREHPSVADVAVVGIADQDWGQVVTAFVVGDPSTPIDKDALAAHCAEHLASFKKPKQIHVVDELPKTHLGKIDRRALAASVAA